MAGAEQPSLHLGTVIDFPVVILLDNDQRDRLNLLIGGKTLPAFVADPPAANGIVILRRPGIDHSRIFMAAKWTFHGTASVSVKPLSLTYHNQQ
jgi:hypothetical protein